MIELNGEKRAQRRNIHGTCVLLGDKGVLITGAPGSGKTSLALRLVSSARRRGLFARIVADDQLLVSVRSGRIICRAPAAIAGLVELRGAGIAEVEYEQAAVVDLRIDLRPAGEIARLPDRSGMCFSMGKAQVFGMDLAENRDCENEIVVFQALFDGNFATERTRT